MNFWTGKTKIAGVMGWPVAHSLSPWLHNHWLRSYGIDGAYIPLEVHPDRLEQAIKALPALGLKGCNVTLPHKEKVCALMDELGPRAKRAGAVNTVIVQENGRLFGDNTDGWGFLSHLESVFPKWDKGPALLIGAGGASRAIAASLLDMAKVPELRITNRTRWRAEKIAEELSGPVRCYDWEEKEQALIGASLIVNTTFLGQAGQPPLLIDLSQAPSTAILYDVVYVPEKTAFLEQGEKRGNKIVSGLGMLVYQAMPGFEAWFGQKPEIEPELFERILKR